MIHLCPNDVLLQVGAYVRRWRHYEVKLYSSLFILFFTALGVGTATLVNSIIEEQSKKAGLYLEKLQTKMREHNVNTYLVIIKQILKEHPSETKHTFKKRN